MRIGEAKHPGPVSQAQQHSGGTGYRGIRIGEAKHPGPSAFTGYGLLVVDLHWYLRSCWQLWSRVCQPVMALVALHNRCSTSAQQRYN